MYKCLNNLAPFYLTDLFRTIMLYYDLFWTESP